MRQPAENHMPNLVGIGNSGKSAAMQVRRPFRPVLSAARTAARGIDNYIADIEESFDGSGFHGDILNVFECYRRLADCPDSASNAKTSLTEHIPGGIEAQVDGEIAENERHQEQNHQQRREPGANPWSGCGHRDPYHDN